MPGPAPQYPIRLTVEREQELRRLVRRRTAPQNEVTRARILLLAHEHPEWSNQQIAAQAHCTDRTVRKWRRAWCQRQSIKDLPRSGAPRRFPPRSAGPSDGLRLQSAR